MQAGPLPTLAAFSLASMSAAEISDRHSWGRQKRLCTATLLGWAAGGQAGPGRG